MVSRPEESGTTVPLADTVANAGNWLDQEPPGVTCAKTNVAPGHTTLPEPEQVIPAMAPGTFTVIG